MSKVIKTVLDPSRKVARVSYGSDHEGAQYFDEHGVRIPFLEQEVDYKPEYDFETRSIKHWWFRNESEIFRDVHTKVATFRSRNVVSKYAKAMLIMMWDRYIGRFL